MYSIKVRWLLDILDLASSDFENVLGIPLVVSKCRMSSLKDLNYFTNCVNSCMESKDDSDYLIMIFSDYNKYFGTKLSIPDPDKDKKLILKIINESYRTDCDLLSLYYKGVRLTTLDCISIDLVSNDANLAGFSTVAG